MSIWKLKEELWKIVADDIVVCLEKYINLIFLALVLFILNLHRFWTKTDNAWTFIWMCWLISGDVMIIFVSKQKIVNIIMIWRHVNYHYHKYEGLRAGTKSKNIKDIQKNKKASRSTSMQNLVLLAWKYLL